MNAQAIRQTIGLCMALACMNTASIALGNTAPALAQTPRSVALYTGTNTEPPRLWPTPKLTEMPRVEQVLSDRAYTQNTRAAARGTLGRLTASELFRKVPLGVRWSGEQATLNYLSDHHVSHIRSVKTTPALAGSARNVRFEPARWNAARGAGNMSFLGHSRVGLHNTGIGFLNFARTAASGTAPYWPQLRWAVEAAASNPAAAARTGTLGSKLLFTARPGIGVAETLARWGHEAWTSSVTRAAGRAVLKAGATGAAAGAVLTIATEAAVGAVKVMNCPRGQEARCDAAAVAQNAAPQVAIAAVTGAAIGGLTKAGALTGATLSAPVVGTLVVAAAVGYLAYTGIRVWREMTPEQKARITGTMAESWARTKGWSSDTITALRFW